MPDLEIMQYNVSRWPDSRLTPTGLLHISRFFEGCRRAIPFRTPVRSFASEAKAEATSQIGRLRS